MILVLLKMKSRKHNAANEAKKAEHKNIFSNVSAVAIVVVVVVVVAAAAVAVIVSCLPFFLSTHLKRED